jgi:DNA processing protein
MSQAPDTISESALRVALASGLGPATFGRLLEALGSIEAIAQADLRAMAHIEGIGRLRAEELRREMDEADIEAERRLMAERGARLIMRGDAAYPALLAAISDPPVALWVRGDIVETDNAALAIVGSRRCTAYGREQAARFASLLAQCGLTIVSGGARGIDGEAHRAAVRVAGRTIVVCGCGLATVYPPEHGELFDNIVAGQGAVLSEYPMSVPPRSQHFPRRNRIISGLAVGVLVIEAGKGSGALITAKIAAEEHGREVMALPGRIDSPASAGCLEALRDGWAGMVLDHADVLSQLESSHHLLRGAVERALRLDGAPREAQGTLIEMNLTEAQLAILTALREAGGAVPVDHLPPLTQLPVPTVMAELTVLQIRGAVARGSDGVRLRAGKVDGAL